MSTPNSQPAVCQIDSCGVIAIGRCLTCKRAFCQTHQGYTSDNFGQRVPYIDMCLPCAMEKMAAAAKQAAEAQAPSRYFSTGAARTDLLTSGVPPVNLYHIHEVWEARKGLFGRGGGYSMKSTLRGRGWILGMFQWKYGQYREGILEDVFGDCLTALVDETPSGANDGLTYVRPCEGGYEDLNFGKTAHFQGDWQTGYLWKEAQEAVRRLVEESKP